jgi:hypothetical protein
VILPVATLALALAAGSPAVVSAAHDLHASHTRLVLEGTTIAARVRLFHDDLELALRALARDSTLKLTGEAPAQALFQRYFAQQVKLEADGRPVALRVTDAGAEKDPQGQLVIWYVLEGEVPAPVRRLVVRQGLLFELYEDQQNIVQLLRMPGEERRTMYFIGTDPRDQAITF